MKHKIMIAAIAMFLMATCVGCGSQVERENPNVSQEENPESGDGFFAMSNLNGTVLEFSDNGCKIIPTIYEENIAYGTAPGYEDKVENIAVTYDENCTFQFAYANLQTGKMSYDTASVSDIKKQTGLVICGEYDSDNILRATRVFIYRMG